MVDSKKQDMKKIISFSVILHYVHYCHPHYQDTRLCVVVSVVYLKKVYINNYYHGMIVIRKNSRVKSNILKTEGLGKIQICIYETYKNTVMPHERHIYAKASDMEKETMYAYPQSDHALPD